MCSIMSTYLVYKSMETLQQKPLQSLILWDENYRVGNVDAIVKSIIRFGYNGAVRVWKDKVVAGNHTVKALQQILATGLQPPTGVTVDGSNWLISVIDVSHLSWLEARAFAVADNRTAELAENDPERLHALLTEFEIEGLLDDIGYESADILDLANLFAQPLNSSIPGSDPGAIDPDSIESPRVKSGQVWKLGNHRLMCGDSTNPEDIAILMDGKKADLFATDPPYVVKYTGNDRPAQGKDWSDVYREIDIKDGKEFFRSVFHAASGFVKERAPWYCWHGEKWAPVIASLWSELGIHWHQTIIWVKPLAAPSYACFAYQHEPCLMGWKKTKKPAFQQLDPQPTTVWNLDWEGKVRAMEGIHPTQKPIEVFGIPMRKHLKPGQMCLELFSGSGSQLIAGEANGMHVRAMEIQPIFCDAAMTRWEITTGEEAELVFDP